MIERNAPKATVSWDGSRVKGQCAFCQSKASTKEDFWPSWLQKTIPATDEERHTHLVRTERGDGLGKFTSDTREKKKSGFAFRQTVKILCGQCNNVWGSGIQEAAKPVLQKMLNGSLTSLNASEMAALFRWAISFTMCHEFKSPETVCISQGTREEFRDIGDVICEHGVWIGRYRGTNYNLVAQHINSGELFPRGTDEGLPDDYPIWLRQSTTFALKDYFLHVFTHEWIYGGTDIDHLPTYSADHVPLLKEAISLSPKGYSASLEELRPLDDVELHALATAIVPIERRGEMIPMGRSSGS
jgi:hypothetical protein